MNSDTKLTGLTGWLDPEGTFYPCEYGKHYILANKLIEQWNIESNGTYCSGGDIDILKKERHYIKMYSKNSMPNKYNRDSYVHVQRKFDKETHEYAAPYITEAQKEWFRDNWNYLDKTQKSYIEGQWIDLNRELDKQR